MKTLLDPSKSLACMYIRTGRYPDGSELRMAQHLLIGAVHLDGSIFVLLSSPSLFIGITAADSDNIGARHTVEQGVDMAFSLIDVSN